MVRRTVKLITVGVLTLSITLGCGTLITEDVPHETTVRVTDQPVVVEEIVKEEPVIEIKDVVEEPTTEWVSLGVYTITAYCKCKECCGKWSDGITSTGVIAQPNHTIAVDPKKIPYGSQVKIGDTIYYAEDCGGAIKQNRIDVYHASHKEAKKFGRKKLEVFIKVGD